MTAAPLTDAQLQLLRTALGLDNGLAKPTRNWLPPDREKGNERDVEVLVLRGFLRRTRTYGPAGSINHVVITNEGMAQVLPPAPATS